MANNFSELITGNNLAKLFSGNFSDYYETKKVAVEIWETRSGNLLTLEHSGYKIEISYDHQKVKNTINCILETPDTHLINQLEIQGMFEGDIFDSEDELVILKPENPELDRAAIHFIKNPNGRVASIKAVYPLTTPYVELIQTLFQKIDKTEIRSKLRI